MNKKQYKYTKLISILCLAIVVINIISLTYAYFTDKAVAEDIVFTTGTVDIEAKVLENGNPSDSFTFTSANVMTWETINRTIRLKTKSADAEPCVVRMKVNFYLSWNGNATWNDVTSKNFLQLKVEDANWTADTGVVDENDPAITYHTYYYYNYAFSGTDAAFDTDISMYITPNFGTEGLNDYLASQSVSNIDTALSNLKYKIILTVDALQFANNGYQAWTDAPQSWKDIVELK